MTGPITDDDALLEARRLNERALELEEESAAEEAERLYREAVRLAPGFSWPWFNLGLLLKRQRRWPESLDANRRAAELDPEDETAWWNLGIAATAVGDWATARAAWTGFGFTLPEGEGPIEDMGFGLTPIRLDPEGEGEVVWCWRLDPARAVVESVPLPESGRRHGDLLLHDGEPRGARHRSDGSEVPVFDELGLLAPSSFGTYAALVEAPSEEDLEALADAASEAGLGFEDWSTIRMICRQCSLGVPHEHQPRPQDEHWNPERTVALAARSEAEVHELLDAWEADGEGRLVEEVRLELGG